MKNLTMTDSSKENKPEDWKVAENVSLSVLSVGSYESERADSSPGRANESETLAGIDRDAGACVVAPPPLAVADVTGTGCGCGCECGPVRRWRPDLLRLLRASVSTATFLHMRRHSQQPYHSSTSTSRRQLSFLLHVTFNLFHSDHKWRFACNVLY